MVEHEMGRRVLNQNTEYSNEVLFELSDLTISTLYVKYVGGLRYTAKDYTCTIS